MKLLKTVSLVMFSGILLLLCACGNAGRTGDTIVGSWKEQVPVTVLGPEEKTPDEETTIIFTFNEDKTGSMEQKYDPDSDLSELSKIVDFSWDMDENTLTLEYSNSRKEQYEVTFDKDGMELSGRMSHSLKRNK